MQMHGLHTSNSELLVHIPHYIVPTLDIKSVDCCHGLRVMSYYETAEGSFLTRNKFWDRCASFLRATHAFFASELEGFSGLAKNVWHICRQTETLTLFASSKNQG